MTSTIYKQGNDLCAYQLPHQRGGDLKIQRQLNNRKDLSFEDLVPKSTILDMNGYWTRKIAWTRDDYFLFSSVFIYKNNQTEILKKNRNRFQPTGFSSVQFSSVWFFMEKTKTKISNAMSLKYVLNHNTISINNQDIYKKLTIWIGF